MTGHVPSYLVRNLVEVALSRTRQKPSRKSCRSKTLCRAMPAKSFKTQEQHSDEAKALLNLHKRFEKEAKRTLCYGRKRHNFFPGKSNFNDSKRNYLDRILSRVSLPASPELHALQDSQQFDTTRLNFRKSIEKITDSCSLPALNDRALPSGKNASVDRGKNSRMKKVEQFESKFIEPSDLQENLTIIPLTKKNFVYYDSLATARGVLLNSNTRSAVGSSRNSNTLMRFLVNVPDCGSEDGMFVDYEEYLKGMPDEESEASFEAEGSRIDQKSSAEVDLNEPTLTVAGYKPLHKRKVHFSPRFT